MRFKPFALRWALYAAFAVFILNAGAFAARAQSPVIVGFGDSLMAGYNLPDSDGFPARLQAALIKAGRDFTVLNAGVSGDTTGGGLERLDWSVPDGAALVILELGANDMLRGLDPAATEQNLDAMLTRMKERKIPVLLAGMRANPGMGAPYQAAFDAIFPRLAEKHGVPLYPFFLDGVAGMPQLLLDDRMHPNAQGVQLMAARILPFVEKALADGGQSGG